MFILTWKKIIVVTPFTVILLVIFSQYSHGGEDISAYLPKNQEADAWNSFGSPEKAVGEDLFLLINGGAEIYYEFGFQQAVMQEYQNENGKSINVEIFEMNEPACAYGIYTFKTSLKGKEFSIGNQALLEDYYLNFWKGNILVTLTGFDSKRETIDGLISLAKAIEVKITSKGQIPVLVDLLLDENLTQHSIKYLKGNLALFNNYEFSSGDIFGLKEGVIGDYGEFKIFIFKYKDSIESQKWFDNATNHIKNSSRFNVYDMPGISNCSVMGRNGDRIFMKWYQEYIIIVIGTATTEGSKIIRKVTSKISDSL